MVSNLWTLSNKSASPQIPYIKIVPVYLQWSSEVNVPPKTEEDAKGGEGGGGEQEDQGEPPLWGEAVPPCQGGLCEGTLCLQGDKAFLPG